jgi:allantoin racemase
LEFKLASIRSLNVKPEDGKDAIQKRLKSAGKSAVEKDGADIVVIGCAQLGFEIEKELREELGVPVILPGLVTVKVAEALIDLGLKQSKKAYPTPPIKIHDFLSIT